MGFSDEVGQFFNDPLGYIKDEALPWIDDAILQPIAGAVQDGLQWLMGVEIPDAPDYSRDRNVQITRGSNIAKLPVVYGRRRIGGIRVFQSTSGASNEYLWMVIALGEGEIDAVEAVYLDDIISTDAKWGTTVAYTAYLGTATQAADSALMSALPSLWTSNHQ